MDDETAEEVDTLRAAVLELQSKIVVLESQLDLHDSRAERMDDQLQELIQRFR